MIWEYLRDRERRSTLVALIYLGALLASLFIGGILLNAMIVFSCVYLGTLITLWRLPHQVPEKTPAILKPVMSAIVSARNFLMKNDLVATITLGLVAASVVNITSVTGLAVVAISAMFGDMLVYTFHQVTSKLGLRDAAPKQAA